MNSLMAGCLAVALLAGCADRGTTDKSALESTDIGYSASGVELIQTDTSGQLRYRLSATELTQDPDSREIRLASVNLRMTTKDNAWRATARKATLSADARQLTFREQVQLEAAGQPVLRMRTERLNYDFLTRQAHSPGSARIEVEAGELTANRIDVDLDRQRLSLGNSVHGRFTP